MKEQLFTLSTLDVAISRIKYTIAVTFVRFVVLHKALVATCRTCIWIKNPRWTTQRRIIQA